MSWARLAVPFGGLSLVGRDLAFLLPKDTQVFKKESGHRQVKDRVMEGFELETRYDTQVCLFFFKFSLVNIQIFLLWQLPATGL